MPDMELTYPDVTFRLGQPRSRTRNGTPYVTMINGIIVPEGVVPPDVTVLPGGEQEAETAAQIQFGCGLSEYLCSERAKVVEWRVPPTMEWSKNGHFCEVTDAPNQVCVRARLAVVKRYAA